MIVLRIVRRIILAVIAFLRGGNSGQDGNPRAAVLDQEPEPDLETGAGVMPDVAPEPEAGQKPQTGDARSPSRAQVRTQKPPVPPVRPRPTTSFGASVELVRKRSRQISEPVKLEALADEVTRTIGTTETENWFGYGDFGRFLEESLPNAEIDQENSGELSPNRDESQDDVLPAVRFLRSTVENFPQRVEIDDWRPMYRALEQALPSVRGSGAMQPKAVYAWTKIARDRTEEGATCSLKRNWLNYVALSLYRRKLVHKGLGHTQIENAFVDLCMKEMRKSGLPTIELERGEAWLRSYEDPHYERRQDLQGQRGRSAPVRRSAT